MDDNHKIPALLPHKLVNALAEHMSFKPDGTAELGKDLEVDGGSFKIGVVTDITKYVEKTFGIFKIKDAFVCGEIHYDADSSKLIISGVSYVDADGLYAGCADDGTYISWDGTSEYVDVGTANNIGIGK